MFGFRHSSKAAQRCYCEADCCRGWIGEEPDSDEEIEDDDEEDEEVEDEVDEETAIVEQSARSSPTLGTDDATTTIESLDALSLPPTVVKTPPIRGRPRKPAAVAAKKPTKPKRAEIMDDLDLDMQIGQLERSQLKNQTQTLAFSRLMVRAKLTDAKLRLLRILCSGELACRRLFLDYHGLKLLHAWLDVDGAGNAIQPPDVGSESNDDGQQPKLPTVNRNAAWELRLQILQTLAVLPIPNKHQLEDSKMLSTVGKWTELSALHPIDAAGAPKEEAATKESSTSPMQKEEPASEESGAVAATTTATPIQDALGVDLPKLLESTAASALIQDINVDALKQIMSSASANEEVAANATKRSDDGDDQLKEAINEPPEAAADDSALKSNIGTTAAADDSQKLLQQIVALAKELVAAWSQLPEVFRIPKRQRIEQMKEHEREANRNYRALTTTADDDAQAQARKNVERFRERERPAETGANVNVSVVKTLTPLRFRSPMALTSQMSSGSPMGASPLSADASGTGINGSPATNAPSGSIPDVSMSKMLRRQQFEAKVAAERQLAEKQHMHETKCAFFRLPAQQTAETAVPFCVNPYTSQWYGLYGHPVATPPSHVSV